MMENGYAEGTITKIDPPKKREKIKIRLMIVCALVMMSVFVYWFADPGHIGYPLIFWMLTIALVFKLLKMLHEWYHYWDVSVPEVPEMKKEWKVDMLTTFCPGEPKDMIVTTLKAMQAVRYPHTSYLCDEGDDPELKAICQELGVVHVTRKIKINAKAGNINNALKQATGDICVILDPDHIPHPEFLHRVLPYFEDDKVGYVQIVQAYGNQEESFVARGAAEQTYHFYGPMMMCMNSYGTVQALGANCTFRRKALDEIGGHAAGLSEDMHTAMQLHAKGWKSMYVPELLSRGLVPATLPAYFKQQLKWSRGTFDLLFKVYPKLFKQFTWRQRIHYLLLPMYFLFGLINFFDITVPIVALTLAETPWSVDIGNFAVIFVPLCMLSLIIRLYAQRWLVEPWHEKGFHFTGGLLRTATWWIFLLGFIYTIFNIKVPYIPTPKGDEKQNNWKLCMPNLIACLLSVAAVIYGLSIDWSPYSFAMATYALINACILGHSVIIGQEKLMDQVKQKLSKIHVYNMLSNMADMLVTKFRSAMYSMFSNGSVAIASVAIILFLGYTKGDPSQLEAFSLRKKEVGGFYKGIRLDPNASGYSLSSLSSAEREANTSFDVVALDHVWGNDNISMDVLKQIAQHGSVPLINWMPSAEGFKDLPADNNLMASVGTGCYRDYLAGYAKKLREYGEPVFICFAPDPDDPANGWSAGRAVDTADYRDAWEFVHDFMKREGISNITWVYSVHYPATAKDYYPGTELVDWVGVNCSNYGSDVKFQDGYSFDQIYKPFRAAISGFQKPVMITAISPAGDDAKQAAWIDSGLEYIEKYYTEVKSVIFCSTGETTSVSHEAIALTGKRLQDPTFSQRPFAYGMSTGVEPSKHKYASKFIKGNAGSWELMVNGAPYYVRGVAYNTGHDWRDGNVPLTRKQLLQDFSAIKAMGANTIRRYDDGMYDDNILNVAEEKGLKVQFGFWFDPKIDYYRDSVQVEEYIQRVEETVKRFKDHPAILSWSIGNETWGLLKHNYGKPYLTRVRSHYLKMIEYLAQRIHEIDPTRPVFSSMEHEEDQLAGEIAAFRDYVPSLDAIGINSYYTEQISQLNYVVKRFDTLRPYMVTEFGPRGYWTPEFSRLDPDSMLVEDSDGEKADYYCNEWKKYVKGHKGDNIGGFAYCFRDRMEGSNTWFGLVDYKGRKKPSYHALKTLWTGEDEKASLPVVKINVPSQKLKPGQEYTFTASIEGAKENYTYEWQLRKREYMEKIDVDVEEDGKTVHVKIPKDPSLYRLYLYVSDENGNVVTASQPVPAEYKGVKFIRN
jgi:cellulose synthase/poly-beta-1,6-N-acetylglucosamine synthase-like glycosyltransferase